MFPFPSGEGGGSREPLFSKLAFEQSLERHVFFTGVPICRGSRGAGEERGGHGKRIHGEGEFFHRENGGSPDGCLGFGIGVERVVEDVGETLEGCLGILDPPGDEELGGFLGLGDEELRDQREAVVCGFRDGLEKIRGGGGLGDSQNAALNVLVPCRRALGRPEGEHGEAMVRAGAVGEERLEGIRGFGAEFAEAPCAQIAGVADGAADEEAVRVHAVAEEAEGGFGCFARAHDAERGAGADVDGSEPRFGATGAKVGCCAIADCGEPGDASEFGKLCGKLP